MKSKEEWIYEYVKANYKKIKVEPGTCRYNYKCHLNAVHDAIEGRHKKVAMVMCLYKESVYPYIHFVNRPSKNKYVDNTLGHWSTQYDYYLIEHVKAKDFFNIGTIFENCRVKIKKVLPIWYRIFHKLDDI